MCVGKFLDGTIQHLKCEKLLFYQVMNAKTQLRRNNTFKQIMEDIRRKTVNNMKVLQT